MAAKETSEHMKEKLMKRNKVSKKIALLVPTMHAQLCFNTLAKTDILYHLEFLDALTQFHENLRLSFYTKIFENNVADSINWENHNAKFYSSKRNFSWVNLLLPTLLITLILVFLGAINLRKV